MTRRRMPRHLAASVTVTARMSTLLALTPLPADAQQLHAGDKAALKALYDATGGDSWYYNNNWNTAEPFNTWYGVATDANGRVTYLDLSSNEMSGSIPAELGNLTELTELYLNDNALHGQIPSELGNLASLEKLYIQSNGLSGPIPSSLGNLTNLESLELRDNRLSGSIPASLGSLTTLKQLNLDSNGLSGSIPSELGNLTNLEELYLSGGGLSGPIPTSLGSLTKLEYLNISHNRLSGSIPAELGDLAKLETLDLAGNTLSGPIPAELGNLRNLQELTLEHNSLHGPVPSQLGNLTNLRILRLRDNRLSGPIPSWLGNLANLEILYLGDEFFYSGLSGAIPSQIGRLNNLKELWLNDVRGTIPTWLANLTNLTDLYLHGAAFQGETYGGLTGQIPSELSNLTKLVRLGLSSNTFTGAIPAELGSLANLRDLALADNGLTGTIPVELGDLTELQRLRLNGNYLSGSIPDELGDLAELAILDLSNNRLSGQIPSDLGDIARPSNGVCCSLRSLRLANNDLRGAIPARLGDLTDLHELKLQNNGLSGAVPTQLSSLNLLDASDDIDLSGTGVCLPSGLQSWSLYSALKSDGVPDCNASSQVPDKPDAPSVDAGDASLSLSWTAPGSDSAAVTRYDVQYKKSADADWITHAHTGAAVTASITGLDNNSEYQARIRAANPMGDSGWSDAATGTPQAAAAPNAPSPTLTAGDTRIRVDWNAPSDNRAAITDYDVQYRQGSSGSWVPLSYVGTARVATISGLNNDNSHQVQVRATNSAGTGAWSTAVSATPKAPAAPSAPGAPTLTAHAYRIAVSWNAPADTGTSAVFDYDVQYRQGSSGDWSWQYHEGAITSSAISSLLGSTSYQVRVRASNSAGSGAWSAAASSTPTGSASGPPTVTLSVNPASISENSATAVITATLSSTETSDVSVTLGDICCISRSGGAAKTISGGSTTATWNITATDNDVNSSDRAELIDATASLSSTPLSVVPATLTLLDDEPDLTANNITHSSARLALGDRTGSWWLQRTDPADAVCKSKGTAYVETVSDLTPDAGYTYAAYSDGACNTKIADVSFRTKELTTRSITAHTVTVELENHGEDQRWWTRRIASTPTTSTGAACKPAGADTSTTLTALSPGTSYKFGAYADSTCNTEIATVSFTTAPAPTFNPQPGPTAPAPPLTDYFIDDGALSRVFEDSINKVARAGITTGCNAEGTRFCPDQPVTRAQMAVFLQRAFKLPTPATTDRFQDVDGFARDAIAAIAQAGITAGCNTDGTRYCPDQPVTRAQMAAFLVRALKLTTPVRPAPFTDIFDHHFRNEITAIAAAKITAGCNTDGTRYCPDQPVTRAQMAVFLARALEL